ncbi:MAG TPA: TatD family hydrolase [Gemmatimonadaceae bacterium]|nr:TatD family hydrolase [Gemmatimonadaceae bacterium]
MDDSSTAGRPPVIAFVDSHSHLADPAFDPDRDSVITAARAAGATGIVCIGESLAAAQGARSLAAAHPDLCAWTAGVHPHDAAQFHPPRDLPALRACLDEGASAVGECGLDYHYDTAEPTVQRAAFEAQLALAAECGASVVVHTRDAAADTAALVREAASAGVRGVLHCFTGPADLAVTALEVGWYVSFSGIITFRRWDDDALLRLPPDDRLLVESDAPYLSPVPHRGHRNEPAWVVHTIQKLADARGTTPQAVAAATAANAHRLFALAPRAPG